MREASGEVHFLKGPPVDSWNSLKDHMRTRFVPPHFRKDLMLRLQRFQQGTLNVDEYYKELETLVLKIELEESEEAMVARFVSGLRKDIQDIVELQEYSSLGSLVHLAMKVEAQLAKKNSFKNASNNPTKTGRASLSRCAPMTRTLLCSTVSPCIG